MKIKINNPINKYIEMPVTAKASLWYMIGNVTQKGIAFFVVPIYTRVLSSSEYGMYSIFQSWTNILVILATLNLYTGVFTKILVDHKDDRDSYTSCMQGLSTTITAILFIFYLIFQDVSESVLELDRPTIIMMFVYFWTYPATCFWQIRQKVEYRYISMALMTIAIAILTPATSLFLLYLTSLRENAVIWGYMIPQIGIGLILYLVQFYRGRVFYNRENWSYALKYNIPLVPHYLSLIVLAQSDRIMIKEYCGKSQAGIYNLAYQISMMMGIFIGSVTAALVPWTYEKLKIKETGSVKRINVMLCIVIGIMTIAAILVAPEIVMIMGTEEYYQAIWVIPAVSISVYFKFVYSLFGNVELYYGKTKYVMVASTAAALINVILNAIFIPKYGFIAAGYTTLLCYFMLLLFHYYFSKQICIKNSIKGFVMDMRFLSASVVFMLISGSGCMLIYEKQVVRIVSIVGIMLMIIIKRDFLINVLREIKNK